MGSLFVGLGVILVCVIDIVLEGIDEVLFCFWDGCLDECSAEEYLCIFHRDSESFSDGIESGVGFEDGHISFFTIGQLIVREFSAVPSYCAGVCSAVPAFSEVEFVIWSFLDCFDDVLESYFIHFGLGHDLFCAF